MEKAKFVSIRRTIMGTVFSLLDGKIEISNQRIQYGKIYMEYQELAEKLAFEFEKIYIKDNKSLEDISNKAYEQGTRIISTAISKSITDLVQKFKIYDIDEALFIDNYYLRYHTWDEDFSIINDLDRLHLTRLKN
jgi:hypothetical protein